MAKDRIVLLAFYDFPAEHRRHIRTTNPIESTFAPVRRGTTKTKSAPDPALAHADGFASHATNRKQRHDAATAAGHSLNSVATSRKPP